MMDQRNLILAIVLSVSILLGFQFLFEAPRLEKERAAQEAQQQQTTTETAPGAPVTPGSSSAPGAGGEARAPVASAPSRDDVVGTDQRIQINSARLRGSISLRGARIDDLVLVDYRETLEPESESITLLSPPGAPNPYYGQFGWSAPRRDVKVPGLDALWKVDRGTLSPGKPVTLTWDNGQGQRFTQIISLDQNYMFSVTQRVRNSGNKTVEFRPYGLISRTGAPDTLGFYILHEGMLGVFDDTLKEVDYDEVEGDDDKPRGEIAQSSTGGWIGITDKYWLTALIPDQKLKTDSRFLGEKPKGQEKNKFQVDFVAPVQIVGAGASGEISSRMFAGAKEVKLLDQYRDELALARFDLAVDWGWLWFLTKPIFQALEYFNGYIGNFGLAILFLTLLIKLAFFPLANKSYRAMSRMKKLQPQMTEIRERFKDDRAKQNTEMMALYRNENANPMAGCFPILIQIPVFFALYKVLFVSIEMRHEPFFGWIHDLSAPDPLGLLTVFGLGQWDVPQMLDVVNVGIWPIIMGGSMYLQQKLNPQPADPTQAKMFMLLPIVFTFLLGSFPAGLVIYWAWNNLLSIAQQWVIMRKMGVSASGQSIKPAAAAAKPKPASAPKASGGKRKASTEAPKSTGKSSGKGSGKRKKSKKKTR